MAENPWMPFVERARDELNAVVAKRRWWNYLFYLGHDEARTYRYILLKAALYELDHPKKED